MVDVSDATATELAEGSKRSGIRWGRWLIVVGITACVALVASIYYFSYPIGISAFQHPLAERIDQLDARFEARVEEARESIAREFEAELGPMQWAALSESMSSMADQVAQQGAGLIALSQANADQDAERDSLSNRVGAVEDRQEQLQIAIQSLQLRVEESLRLSDIDQMAARVSATSILAAIDEDIRWRAAHQILLRAEQAVAVGDKDEALSAYAQASAVLADVDDAQGVMQQLIFERSLIEQWRAPDWQRWQQELAGIFGNVDAWTLATDAVPSESAETAHDHTIGMGERAKKILSGLVAIRPRRPDMVSLGEAIEGKQLIPQRLVLLELALARRQVDIVRYQASALSDLITRAFDERNESANAAIVWLVELSMLTAAPPPTGLGVAKEQLQTQLDAP